MAPAHLWHRDILLLANATWRIVLHIPVSLVYERWLWQMSRLTERCIIFWQWGAWKAVSFAGINALCKTQFWLLTGLHFTTTITLICCRVNMIWSVWRFVSTSISLVLITTLFLADTPLIDTQIWRGYSTLILWMGPSQHWKHWTEKHPNGTTFLWWLQK